MIIDDWPVKVEVLILCASMITIFVAPHKKGNLGILFNIIYTLTYLLVKTIFLKSGKD